ncbi:uncharacterized protein LOC143599326 [Bidens hawaiensis]|uniref:uncharacterized protein LOC143599326 n=1 Tax=Bidens hawaiensis TaxID=980011 RepID=UPI00404AF4EE
MARRDSISAIPIPVFKGDGYDFWQIRMKTILISQDLWKENRKKDAKALAIIQQGVHDEVFSRIAAATQSKKAWNLLKNEYQGDTKMKIVRLQGLRREFETSQMKEGEQVADYLSKVMKIINQQRAYGDDVTDQTVVEKRGVNRGHVRGRGRVFGRGREGVQCYNCNRFGHVRSECWSEPQANAALEGEDGDNEGRLFMAVSGCYEQSEAFMANNNEGTSTSNVWFLDSGCSNHMTGQKKLFKTLDDTEKVQSLLASVDDQDSLLWHLRYGHLNGQSLKVLRDKGMVKGLPTIQNWSSVCEGCVFGKQTRQEFPHNASRATHIMQLIHTDVVGPMPVPSLGGSRYFVLFTDDYSRMTWVYFLREKSEVFGKFKILKAKIENETGGKIKAIRSDNGGEFCSKEFNMFCDNEGIRHNLTAPYTPQQKGGSERKSVRDGYEYV